MGAIKPFNYSKSELQIALNARALMHPCRIRIMNLLITKGALTSEAIQHYFRFSKTTVREHIEKLKEGGFVNIEYQPHYYTIHLASDQQEWVDHLEVLECKFN